MTLKEAEARLAEVEKRLKEIGEEIANLKIEDFMPHDSSRNNSELPR